MLNGRLVDADPTPDADAINCNAIQLAG